MNSNVDFINSEYVKGIIDTIRDPLIVLNHELKIISASHSFYEIFEVTKQDVEGRFIYDLGNGEWNIPSLRQLLENILPNSSSFDGFKIEHNFKMLGKRTLLLNARRIPSPPEKQKIIIISIEDITIRIQKQDYQKSLEFSNSIVNSVRSPLIILDHKLLVVSASNSFYVTFKVDQEETLGRLIYDIGNGQWNIPRLHELFNDIINNNRNFENFEVEHNFTHIGKKIMLLNAAQIISATGKSEYILLSIEDITQRRQNEMEISRIYQAKTAFTAMVSHELRTPLTSLKESLYILISEKVGQLNQKQVSFLSIAKRNLDRLITLVNDVLKFLKLDAKKMLFALEENDIGIVLNEIKELMEPIINKKGLKFIVENNSKVKAIFDTNAIIEVLVNLVSNALKATDKGWIKLSANYYPTDNFMQISVQDTGCGINEEDLPKLFHAFEQIKRKTGGTGLGLAISKQIIEEHNGKIWIESVLGTGTTVYFSLPISIKDKKIKI